MSVEQGKLVSYLNQLYRVGDFKESAINGLQIASPKKKIEKIAFAVDGVMETFQQAAEWGADMLIVHHGIYWGFQYPLRGPDFKRVKLMIDREIALYAAHLPMDAHPELGHNVNLLKALGVGADSLEPFGDYRGQTIGFQGKIAETKRQDLTKRLETLLGGAVKLLPFGPEKVRSVACVTGAGADFALVREAKIRNVHYYISGEAMHPIYHYAKENRVTVALGGHYNTEVFGLHALRSHLEAEFGISGCFIECPTGM